MKQIVHFDHYTVLSAGKVRDICYPFFKVTPINGFCYARIFDQGMMYCLNTHAEWFIYHLEREYPLLPPVITLNANNRTSFILLPESTTELYTNILKEIKDNFGLDYPYYMVEHYQDYYDVYIFTTYVNHLEIINFYLNHQAEIEKFKHYFKGYGKNLITEATNHMINLTENMHVQFNTYKQQQKSENIIPKNYTIHYNKKDIFFTAKEAECLKYLNMGHDLKGVAKMMNISFRTVEFHLNNIKNKTGVHTVSRLLVLLNSLDTKMRFW